MREQLQHIAGSTPGWANWLIITGSAVASWLAPIASLIAIIWGCLQIYSWFERRIVKGQQ